MGVGSNRASWITVRSGNRHDDNELGGGGGRRSRGRPIVRRLAVRIVACAAKLAVCPRRANETISAMEDGSHSKWAIGEAGPWESLVRTIAWVARTPSNRTPKGTARVFDGF